MSLYKAKGKQVFGDKTFEAGELYTIEQLEGVDLTDFEVIEASANPAEAPAEEIAESVEPELDSEEVTEDAPAEEVAQ